MMKYITVSLGNAVQVNGRIYYAFLILLILRVTIIIIINPGNHPSRMR